MSTQANEPRLAAPGAGLPWIELQVAKIMTRTLFRRSHRRTSEEKLESERREILELAGQRTWPELRERILIPRLRGMEDSSRNWSVLMTIEHLAIVNALIAETIRSLGEGKIPDRVADTAAVKPSPSVDEQALERFKTSCADVTREAGRLQDLRTPVKHSHPWFGPLDAAGWHFMAGFHMALHRRQILEILRVLNARHQGRP